MTTYNYVTVVTTMKDENAGNVWAVLLKENLDTTAQNTLRSEIEANTDYAELLTPSIEMYDIDTIMKGNVDYAFADATAFRSNITESLVIGQEYFLYLYAIDNYDNAALYKMDDPITVSTESTIVNATDIFLSSGSGYEMRTAGTIDVPSVAFTPDGVEFFGYLSHDDFDIHANVDVDPGEYNISKLYTIATEDTYDPTENDLITHVLNGNGVENTFNAFGKNVKQNGIVLTEYFTGPSTSTSFIVNEANINVHSVIHARGTNAYLVTKNVGTARLGEPPLISETSVSVVARN